MTQKRNVTWFLVLTLAISWPLFLLPLVLPGSAIVAWMLAMFAPGLSAIIVTRYVAREPLSTLNLRRLGPKRFYLWAWLLPPLLAVVTLGVTVTLGIGELDTSFSAISAALPAEAAAVPVWLIVLGQVVAAVVLAPLINVVLGSMGEELGWRGFLLPRLLEIGKWRAVLLSSLIWGLWHAPVILQGHNYPQNPALGVLLMTVWCVPPRHLSKLALSRDPQSLGSGPGARRGERHRRPADDVPTAGRQHDVGRYARQRVGLVWVGRLRSVAGAHAPFACSVQPVATGLDSSDYVRLPSVTAANDHSDASDRSHAGPRT